VTKFIIHIDTAREHPAFIADFEAAGCEIELYDELDYVSRPGLRDGARRVRACRHRSRRLD
jgi:hypothetical protein